jgi:hypothetical protein
MRRYLEAWSRWLQSPAARWETGLTALALVGALAGFVRFLGFVEARPGVVLPDPVLALFAPRNLSGLTFGIIYLSLLLALVLLAAEPRRLLFGAQAYCMLLLVRALAMSLVPLEAPPATIELRDPLVASASAAVTKDLFFSGHTSTMFLLFLVVPGRWPKAWMLAGTLAVATFVLLQHVHYTIDAFAAPFFAYGAVRLLELARAALGLRPAAQLPAATGTRSRGVEESPSPRLAPRSPRA